MSIAENLKKLRKERRLSQTALAAKAGVRQQLISQIENGVNVTTKKLPEIARALGCEPHDLDPAYRVSQLSEDDPLMRKLNRLLGENDEGQLRRLDEYLDFLLAHQSKSRGSTQ